MENLKDRLKWLAQQKGLSMRAFEEKCGLGRGNISNMSQDGTLGPDKLTKIIDAFQELTYIGYSREKMTLPVHSITKVLMKRQIQMTLNYLISY